LVTLARWIAGYYVCPLGMVFGSLLPAAVKNATGQRSRPQVRPPAPGSAKAEPPGSDDPETPKLTKLQQAVLDAAVKDGGWLDPRELADRGGAKSTSPVTQLIEKGLLESRRTEMVTSDLDLRAQRVAPEVGHEPPELMPSQAHAVEHLTAALNEGFSVHLLHGITGSGKTEVYLRVIQAMLGSRGQGAEGPRGRVKKEPVPHLTPRPLRLRRGSSSWFPRSR
jgi:primosomal protein N' (replication factor Y)